ncbi:MAG TPA: hypothetical protein GX700_08270 [Paracoccus sp.]|nr:hypothetical protein [Paracoccus sp. (in: a-proteobacteria)]
MLQDELILPPPYTLFMAQGGDILDEAAALAPEHGAGTLLVQQAPGLLALAVVLEPEEPLEVAQMAFLLGMSALGDALAAHCPPERPVRFGWPDELRYDKARLGGGRFLVPTGCAPDEVPEWMVFAAELIADRDHLDSPGEFPDSLSLKEDEFDPPEAIISTFASYMMLYFDRWTHEGLDAVTNRYLMRIDPPLLRGVRRIEGDRLIEITPSGGRRYPPLMEAMSQSDWRDAKGPKL